jgi:hypothetical protein
MKNNPYQVKSEVVIERSPQKVWEVLTDFSKYPEWNPFIRIAKGTLKKNGKIFIVLTIPGGWIMLLRPRILEVKERHEIKWLGSFMLRGIFDGEHLFSLVGEGENNTRLVQKEEFRGILIPCLGKLIGRGAKMGFDAMNAALKKRVENPEPGPWQLPGSGK